jgi:hypothetical protein
MELLCPKHIEFYNRIKLGQLVRLVGCLKINSFTHLLRQMPTYYSSWPPNDSFPRPSNFCSFSRSLFDVMLLIQSLKNHKTLAYPESQILWREVLCEWAG